MKTIEQWLNELPEPYRSQALENVKTTEMLESEHESLHSSLVCGFSWQFSPQGHEYWQEFLNTLPR